MWRVAYIRGHRVASAVAIIFLTASIVALGQTPRPASAAITDLPYRLQPAMTSSIGIDQHGLVADGSLIVWQDSRTGTPDIYAYDLDDSREFRVSHTAGYRTEPAISGSTIVWVAGADAGSRRIEAIDLTKNVEFAVTDQPGEVSTPAIDDGVVVWRERRGAQWAIAGKVLATGNPIQFFTNASNAAHPSISGSKVVWQGFHDGNWDIFLTDLGSGQSTALTSTPDNEIDPVISGKDVLFLRQPVGGGPPKIVVMHLDDRSEQVVVSDHMVMPGTIKNGIVVWEDWRTGLPDVYAYDIEHDTTFAVARSQQAYDPVVCSRAIAFVSRSDLTRGRVQAVATVQRLPTDPREPPAVPSPDNIYIPETRHFMSAGFKSYWQANGGPALFGYPLTEEFSEKNPATGQEITVQYFERVKMEFHPDAPAGQRVSLARLGAELTSDRDFKKVEPFEDDDNHVYFPETGHSIAFGFKEFWEENGGLGTFGFPISEELTENGRTVQYFERARFEFNPDAKAGAKVSLGLLGQDALQRKGWLPTPPIDTTQILP